MKCSGDFEHLTELNVTIINAPPWRPDLKSKIEKTFDTIQTVYPPYDPAIKEKSAAERLVALTSLYDIYHPSHMSAEIYSKIHLATLRSLQKKQSITAVRQLAANKKMMMQQQGRGIISGADCFTIIGKSGIGKSSAVWRAISLIGANRIIEWDEPFQKVIPCLVVQCPFDSSVKNDHQKHLLWTKWNHWFCTLIEFVKVQTVLFRFV